MVGQAAMTLAALALDRWSSQRCRKGSEILEPLFSGAFDLFWIYGI
jgi:hypothetical protein